MPSTIIAVVNQKGGVGKTTTAVNLGACLAELGQDILLVDLDPQGNATTALGFSSLDSTGGLYALLSDPGVLDKVVLETKTPGLDLIPSSLHLAGAEIELALNAARDDLRQCILPAAEWYDAVIVDTPPSLGILTLNAFAAAHFLLIPTQCEYFALEGLRQLFRTIELVRRSISPNLQILGAVRTMHDVRTSLSHQVVEQVARHFPGRVFQTIIPRNVRLGECPSYGEPIIIYDPRSSGATAYRNLAREVLAVIWPDMVLSEQEQVERLTEASTVVEGVQPEDGISPFETQGSDAK